MDKENKEMLRFESEYGGMGKFRFRPEAGAKYKAIVWKEGGEGKKAEFNIPDIETEGYNIIYTPERVSNNDKGNHELLGNAIKIKLTKSYKKATGTEEYMDSVLYVGDTLTDRKGNFEFVCDFNGRRGLRLETSKKKNGKNKKIDKLIMLKRDVAPVCRVSYLKSNPWPEEKKKESQTDSLAEKVTISNSGIKVRRTKEGYLKTLPEVKVTKKTFNEVIRNEAVAVYNVDRIREDLKDKGEYNFNTANLYEGLYEMLYSQDYKDWDRIESYNKYRNTRADTCENVAGELRYKGKKVIIVNASWTQNRIGENGNIANLAGGYTINDVKKILVLEDPEIIRQYLRVYDTELEHLFDYSAVVVFYLYPDGKNRREYVGIRNAYYEGYSLVKEFYSPDYSMDKDLPELDHRRTLYWNPDVRTDSAGHALINFYNNDNSTDMEFTVEGFSDSGLPGDIIKE